MDSKPTTSVSSVRALLTILIGLLFLLPGLFVLGWSIFYLIRSLSDDSGLALSGGVFFMILGLGITSLGLAICKQGTRMYSAAHAGDVVTQAAQQPDELPKKKGMFVD